ncbi:hypothetical protein EYB25_001727 [Talaromyces marneffei]|uniref:C6 transcription factor n=1 Tax=Talaromyces marneffei (strain ATCC 18224 / CBS 334.59 / QM 7333) TaxID=441960 RepID=B6Q4K8_TALMQ|nr:uncharacterized protein EYB26_000607 [Talaromyces marneffei]EEA27267.1 conserved hypothetical protein [Talaromyces marneffei ATCC 18224]KAE8557021.1 hypothetical protein EYB25_001727 [Talaromyces marneffei]QGA12962.1 hypothetical protein EYB26_000607 [Talaromyces marneffei]
MRKLSISSFQVQPGWVTTNDERRCFAYFQRYSLPNLGLAFNSSLWRKTILQISHVDPAVYHAAIMLGSIHEDSIENRMRLSGENLLQARHRFAFEQASRAYSFLAKRQASQDPQLLEVVPPITCREAEEYRLQTSHQRSLLDNTLIGAFQMLDAESSHFGSGAPFITARNDLNQEWLDQKVFSRGFGTVSDVYQSLTMLMNEGIPFLARCWPLSRSEATASYGELSNRQQQLLSFYFRFQEQFQMFKSLFYDNIGHLEQRAVDLLQIQYLGQVLSLKTCLIKGPIPTGLTPEYLTLLSAHELFLGKFSELSSFILDYGIIPGLWVIASECPLYSVRIRAIKMLQSWPHAEVFKNSNTAASLALEIIKKELQAEDGLAMSITDEYTDKELTHFLFDTLSSTQDSENWSFIRAYNVLER